MPNLKELTASVRTDDQTFKQIDVPAESIEVRAEELRIDGRSWNFGEGAHRRVYRVAAAPTAFLRTLTPQTQAGVVKELLTRSEFGPRVTVVVREAEVFTIRRSDLTTLSRHEVLEAAMDGLGDDAEYLLPARIDTEGDSFEIELATPRKSIDVEPGDTVQAGLHISHSMFEERATVVRMFTLRLICTNGMTHRSCPSQGGAERTRRLPLNHPNGKELQKAQVKRLVRETWQREDALLTALKSTRERKADVEGLLVGWLNRARISTAAMMPRLLDAWQQEGRENTHFGAINALTRVATHGERLTARQRRTLSSLAGLLAFSNIHICPRCFSVLSPEAIRGEDS